MHPFRISFFTFAAILLALAAAAYLPQNETNSDASVIADMEEAALDFLETVPADRMGAAVFPFEHDERTFWNFIPMTGERKGLPVKEMSFDQSEAMHALLRSALSAQGYLKATSIQQLERILGEIENNPARRDPAYYYLTIFGNPAEDAPWGWRFEGHHISINFSIVEDELSVTPAFMGANPAQVRQGAYAGWEVLHNEISLARTLMDSFSDEQLEEVIISSRAPRDIITGNQREVMLETYEGLALSEMSPAQQDMMLMLLAAYVHNLKPDIASVQLARIKEAGIENLHFAWAGSLSPGEGHYYRIHGPKTLIEYDNTQNDANHIHAVWRDFENDFGRDLLKLHYEQSGPQHGH